MMIQLARAARRMVAGVMLILAASVALGQPTGDPYFSSVVLLLHGDGAAGSTSITDSSASGKALTSHAGAQISTAQSKFGGSSLYFNGSGAYFSSPNSADFRFGTGDFTVEFFFYSPVAWTSQPYSASMIGQKASDGTSGWVLYSNGSNTSRVSARISGGYDVVTASTPAAGVWQHWALTRKNGVCSWWLNGTLDASAPCTADIQDTQGSLFVGKAQTWGGVLNGYLDEVRVTKGVARYTANFVVPSGPFPDSAVVCPEPLVLFNGNCTAQTTTALSSSPNPSSYSATVTLTATVSGTNPATGTVTFKDGSSTLGTGTLNGGVASIATTTLSAGSHGLSASYSGDSANAPSLSPTLNHVIEKYAAVAANLTATPNPSAAGQAVTLTAAVTGISPTGSVTFMDGGTVLGSRTLSNGNASLATTALAAGTRDLTAVYSGDTTNVGATSGTYAQEVGVIPSSLTLSASSASVGQGEVVTLIARVAGFMPTGSVTFAEGSAVLGTANVTGGSATLGLNSLPVGMHSISAAYAGDANNTASSAAAVGVSVAARSGYTWQYGYDAMGRRTTAVNPNGQATYSYYDGLGRLIQIQQPANVGASTPTAIDLGYNARGDLTQVTDPRDLVTTYSRNSVGEVTARTSPDTGASQYTYDANGNALTSTDARGKLTQYTYDRLDRVISISYASGTGTSFEYDGGATPTPATTGKLTRMTDESGQTTYAYDGFGRLTSKTVMIGARTFSVGYSWGDSGSALDKLTAITYPSGSRVNFSYDQHGSVSGVTVNPVNPNGQGVSSASNTLLSGLTYNADLRVTGWLWSDGKARTIAYDGNGFVSSYNLGDPLGTGSAAGLLRTIQRDAAGRITGYTHTAGGNPAAAFDQAFGYDNLDRLTTATRAATNTQYSYDATGNRTASTIGGTIYTNSISATSNRVDQVQDPSGTATVGYDAAGNVVGDGSFVYTYSDRSRMAGVTTSSGAVAYLYNGMGQRAKKSGPTGAVLTGASHFVYDEAGQLLGEYDANGSPVYETIYLGSSPVGALKQTGGAATGDIATTVHNVHADHIDTPRVITRQDQTVVWRWDAAEAFGATAPDQNPTGQGVFAYNQRFPGQVFDQETGLLQNWNRDYRASWGRYIQSDPIGLSGGINTFAYVGGDPLTRIDPRGMFFTTVDAFCLRYPDQCGEIIGDIIRGGGAASGDPCVAEAANSAADSVTAAGQFAASAAAGGRRSGAGRSGSTTAKPPGSGSGGRGGAAEGTSWGSAGGYAGGSAPKSGAAGAGTDRAVPDSTIVCRGGSCTADAFRNGRGVEADASGRLSGISTGIGSSVAAASKNIPHPNVGVTTAGDIRAAGGQVVNDHGNHANVSGVTAQQAADLFKNVVRNPNK